MTEKIMVIQVTGIRFVKNTKNSYKWQAEDKLSNQKWPSHINRRFVEEKNTVPGNTWKGAQVYYKLDKYKLK